MAPVLIAGCRPFFRDVV